MHSSTGDPYATRQAAILETLTTGGFIAPALLDLRLHQEHRLRHRPPHVATARPSLGVGIARVVSHLGTRLFSRNGQFAPPTVPSPEAP